MRVSIPALLLLFAAMAQAQLPVLPGLQGFGVDTPAGRGGAILRVTNLNASGDGSLRAALETQGPRTILFEVGGVIDLSDSLVIHEPFVTVAGQTAPSPGITIVGAGIVVVTHDILLQHLRVRVGDRVDGPDPGGRDALGIYGDAETGEGPYNVVVDHCSFSWAIDEGISTWNAGVRDITIHACISAENLANSLHPEGEHSKGFLIGDHTQRIAVLQNLFAHNTERNPLVKGDVQAVVANNLIYNPRRGTIHFSDPEGSGPSTADIVGNVLILGPDTFTLFNRFPIVHASFDTKRGSAIFLQDNAYTPAYSTPLKPAQRSQARRAIRATTPSLLGNAITPMDSADIVEHVLANAGARPADRDATDIRIVESVTAGTGGIIDSQDEVGGFPVATETRHTLEIPENPTMDDDGDGYTNLEERLHELGTK